MSENPLTSSEVKLMLSHSIAYVNNLWQSTYGLVFWACWLVSRTASTILLLDCL